MNAAVGNAKRRWLTRREFMRLAASAAACAVAPTCLAGCDRAAVRGDVRRVVDMGGREVSVPQQIGRVFCTNPIGTVNLFGLAPQKMAGWNFAPSGDARKYIPDEYLALPSLGVWMGAGSTPNAEEVVAQEPDVLLCYWTADEAGCSMADDIQEQTGLPVVLVDYDVRSTPDSFRFVGNLIGADERGEELAAFCERKLSAIEAVTDAVPEAARKAIFLAQGNNGLTTDPVGSMHATDALELIKTSNVADLPGLEGQGMGMPTVNLEQIISWKPDAVLVSEFSMSDSESSDVYAAIKADPHWLNVPCVGEGEVYRIPQAPFSWFGRPPSAVRLLGCLWLLKVLYPDYAQGVSVVDETLEFYRVFYGYDSFDEASLERLLTAAGVDDAAIS